VKEKRRELNFFLVFFEKIVALQCVAGKSAAIAKPRDLAKPLRAVPCQQSRQAIGTNNLESWCQSAETSIQKSEEGAIPSWGRLAFDSNNESTIFTLLSS
jgi:hypothetical protein